MKSRRPNRRARGEVVALGGKSRVMDAQARLAQVVAAKDSPRGLVLLEFYRNGDFSQRTFGDVRKKDVAFAAATLIFDVGGHDE